MFVDATITVVCENVSRGEPFRAIWYDHATECFYAGSGDRALKAVAWALDEYVSRAILKRPHTCAGDPRDLPGEPWTPYRADTTPRLMLDPADAEQLRRAGVPVVDAGEQDRVDALIHGAGTAGASLKLELTTDRATTKPTRRGSPTR